MVPVSGSQGATRVCVEQFALAPTRCTNRTVAAAWHRGCTATALESMYVLGRGFSVEVGFPWRWGPGPLAQII